MAKLRKKQEETDYGRIMIDEQLEKLEARLTAMYGQATREMVANLEKGLAEFAEEDKKKREDLENGIITEVEYSDWRMKHIYRTNQMKVQIEDLTQTLVNADVEAMKIINDKTPEFYASSYNFAGFKAETEAKDAGIDYDTFKIYNKDAIKYILKEDPDLLPQGSVDIPKDERWNRQHISNEIAQGILQGDSIPKIADRLQSVTNMDRNAAIRNARTATTGAENKGRKDAVERVREDGIPQEEWWIATHDGRTRESHILLDGQKPDENGIYANGCAYPGDPAGDPEEIYNCRCSIGSGIPGVDHSKDSELYAKFMEENYFEDWLVVKEKREQKESEFQKNKEKAEERRKNDKKNIPLEQKKELLEIPEPARKEIDRFEKSKIDKNKEYSMVVDANGKIIAEAGGAKFSTHLTQDENIKSEGNYHIHNHPLGNVIYSDQDIHNYELYGVRGGIVITKDGTEYELVNTNPVSKYFDVEELNSSYARDLITTTEYLEKMNELLPFSSEVTAQFERIENEWRTDRREKLNELYEQYGRQNRDIVNQKYDEWKNEVGDDNERKAKWLEENSEVYGFVFGRRKVR